MGYHLEHVETETRACRDIICDFTVSVFADSQYIATRLHHTEWPLRHWLA